MTFCPLHDRVVVRCVDAEEKTAGGIIIPDTAKEKPQQGEVLAVGPGKRDETGKLIPLDVRVGDHILFGKWSGTEVEVDGEDRLIMKEDDIMGVVETGGTPTMPQPTVTKRWKATRVDARLTTSCWSSSMPFRTSCRPAALTKGDRPWPVNVN